MAEATPVKTETHAVRRRRLHHAALRVPGLALMVACSALAQPAPPSALSPTPGMPALAAAAATTTTASARTPLTIDQAWERLQAESGAIRAARSGVEAATLEAEATRSLDLPHISANATAVKLRKTFDTDISSVSGPVNQALGHIGAQTGLTLPPVPNRFDSSYDNEGVRSWVGLAWPLYTGGKISATQRLAAAKGEEARAKLRETSESGATALAKRYYGLQLARYATGIQQDVVAAMNEHLRQARGFERQGQIARVETLHAQVALDEQRRNLLKAQDEAEIAQVALSRLLDLPAGVEPRSALFVRSQPLGTLNEWIDAALAGNAQLSMLTARRSQSEQGLAIARSAALPSVTLVGEYQFNKRVLTPVEPDWIVALNVKFTLLDSLDRRSMIGAAHAVNASVDAMMLQARRDVATGIEKYWREADQARQRYLLMQSSLEQAQENFRLRAASFREGQSTSLDVVDARLMLARAQLERAREAHDYDIALAQLLEVAGASEELPQLSASSDIRIDTGSAMAVAVPTPRRQGWQK